MLKPLTRQCLKVGLPRPQTDSSVLAVDGSHLPPPGGQNNGSIWGGVPWVLDLIPQRHLVLTQHLLVMNWETGLLQIG